MVVNGDVHCCQKAPSMLLIVTFVYVVGVVGDGFLYVCWELWCGVCW
jgi:hypothetical protein